MSCLLTMFIICILLHLVCSICNANMTQIWYIYIYTLYYFTCTSRSKMKDQLTSTNSLVMSMKSQVRFKHVQTLLVGTCHLSSSAWLKTWCLGAPEHYTWQSWQFIGGHAAYTRRNASSWWWSNFCLPFPPSQEAQSLATSAEPGNKSQRLGTKNLDGS